MIRKQERLTKESFSRFFSSKKRYHTKGVQLIYTPHKKRHIAVVVPKKIVKSAPERNTIRRRVYQIARNHTTEGVFIFILKANAKKDSYQTLKEGIIELISKTTRNT